MWRERLIRSLGGRVGGYATIEEAIEAVRQMKGGEEKRALLTMAVRRLFNSIGPEDILKTDTASAQWTYMGKPISKEETQVLVEQAHALYQSKLWDVLQKDLKYQANKRMFTDSQNLEDMVAGKLLLFYVDIIHTRIKRLAGAAVV